MRAFKISCLVDLYHVHVRLNTHSCSPAASLSSLEQFIKVTSAGLDAEVAEGDYSGLVGVMALLLAVKDKTPGTDTMFEPLKATTELLKTYGQELPDEVHLQLQVRMCMDIVYMYIKKYLNTCTCSCTCLLDLFTCSLV